MSNGCLWRTLEPLEIVFNPTDAITVAGASANSATMRAGLLNRELF
tara:strand:- start:8738 stop:8875 length:138 start_codon:yes stop_codon:yes gene_type:complete